jgi:HlyD family secretion protein
VFPANAEIIIDEKKDILILPERVVTFRNDSAFVKVPVEQNQFKEKYIKTGISDGLSIEIIDGLKENDEVQEPPQVEIS